MTKYRIRLTEMRDIPYIEELHRQQNERDGTNYPLTQVFDEHGYQMTNVVLSVVIVDEADKVHQGVIFERGVEMMLSGCDAEATAQLEKQINGLWYLLRQKGYSNVHCLVPKDMVIPIEKPMKRVGFQRDDFKLAHFYKSLEAPK